MLSKVVGPCEVVALILLMKLKGENFHLRFVNVKLSQEQIYQNKKRRMDFSRLNADTLEEIFSRLTLKEIGSSKCVSKAWLTFMSSQSFILRYLSKSVVVSGLFFQQHEELPSFVKKHIIHVPIENEYLQRQERGLNFLPERVSIVSCNNGLLCCRSLMSSVVKNIELGARIGRFLPPESDPKIYVCNPTTKEFTTINPAEKGLGINIGLSFDPYSRIFQLVSIHCERNPEMFSLFYTFSIFSSETFSWRLSKSAFKWNSIIHRNRQIFVNGRFYWATLNHHLITFQIENEAPGVIMLPGLVMTGEGRKGMCLGSSKGRLNYVVAHPTDYRIWVLKSYEKQEWNLAYKLDLFQLYDKNIDKFENRILWILEAQKDNAENVFNNAIQPLAYKDDVLFLDAHWYMFSLDMKTSVLKNYCCMHMLRCEVSLSATILPYTISLAGMNLLGMNFLRLKQKMVAASASASASSIASASSSASAGDAMMADK